MLQENETNDLYIKTQPLILYVRGLSAKIFSEIRSEDLLKDGDKSEFFWCLRPKIMNLKFGIKS